MPDQFIEQSAWFDSIRIQLLKDSDRTGKIAAFQRITELEKICAVRNTGQALDCLFIDRASEGS
jgi:hypothetical protein